MSKKGAQFLTGPSDSSLVRDHAMRKRVETPRRHDRQDKTLTATPRFYDKNPLIPDKNAKVAVFNSNGEKTIPSQSLDILTAALTDSDSLHVAPSGQLHRTNDVNTKSNTLLTQMGKMQGKDMLNTQNLSEQDIQSKMIKIPSKHAMKRNRRKTSIIRKKRSKTDMVSSILHEQQHKETSTESMAQSSVTTQTDQRLSYCRKCLQQNTAKPITMPTSSTHKLETKVARSPQYVGQESRIVPTKPNNAFCTAVNVTLPPQNSYNAGDTSHEISRVASVTDANKNKRVTANKRRSFEKNEVHQEILSLKKTAEKAGNHTKKSLMLNTALPFNAPGALYHQIKKANKNGSLRYILSMIIFGILLFWLISAIFHFDFVLEVFRTIGRYLASIPIFITRRKKEASKAEIVLKYVGSFARILRAILRGPPTPGGY